MDDSKNSIKENEPLDLVALDNNVKKSSEDIVTDLVSAETCSEFDAIAAEFNLNQKKKNAIRVVKLTNLLGKIEDQAIERFNKKPDQMSNKELIEYLQAIQNSIDRSQNYVDKIEEKPMIQINQQTNTIKIEDNQLSRESKEKVLSIVSKLLKEASSEETENIIDAESIEPEEK